MSRSVLEEITEILADVLGAEFVRQTPITPAKGERQEVVKSKAFTREQLTTFLQTARDQVRFLAQRRGPASRSWRV